MSERKYRVAGTRTYRGHAPGTIFSADLDEEHEARAIARGSITLDTSAASLEDQARDELNQLAKAAGVSDPESLSNKSAVVDAIRAHEKE